MDGPSSEMIHAIPRVPSLPPFLRPPRSRRSVPPPPLWVSAHAAMRRRICACVRRAHARTEWFKYHSWMMGRSCVAAAAAAAGKLASRSQHEQFIIVGKKNEGRNRFSIAHIISKMRILHLKHTPYDERPLVGLEGEQEDNACMAPSAIPKGEWTILASFIS